MSSLVLSASAPRPLPLTVGDDISWLARVRGGDDQGSHGACALFSIANWAEIMMESAHSDREILDLYQSAKRRYRRLDGLTHEEAFEAARDAGWLPGASRILPTSDLVLLTDQPIIAGYAITDAWRFVSPQGCLDHSVPARPASDYHSQLIVGCGRLAAVAGGPWVYLQNWWGERWGYHGLCVMSYALHAATCRELWFII